MKKFSFVFCSQASHRAHQQLTAQLQPALHSLKLLRCKLVAAAQLQTPTQVQALEAGRSFDTAAAALSKAQRQLQDAQRELAQLGLGGQMATAAAAGVGGADGARVAPEAAAAAAIRSAGSGLAALTTEHTGVSCAPIWAPPAMFMMV